jgi:hypothetical protein
MRNKKPAPSFRGRFIVGVFGEYGNRYHATKTGYKPNSAKSDPRYTRSFSPRIPRERHIIVHK